MRGKKKREANRNKIKQGCIRSNQKISQETRVSRRGEGGGGEREAGTLCSIAIESMKSCRVEDLTKGIYARLVDEKVKGQRERSIVEEEERALGDLGRERERGDRWSSGKGKQGEEEPMEQRRW